MYTSGASLGLLYPNLTAVLYYIIAFVCGGNGCQATFEYKVRTGMSSELGIHIQAPFLGFEVGIQRHGVNILIDGSVHSQ